MTLSATELALVDRWQRDFPLIERPFVPVGQSAGLDEERTIEMFDRLCMTDVISRIGAVVRPHTAGVSTLAAMQVPAERLHEVAAAVSAEPFVTHNYERDHPLNLWFVIAGPSAASVAATITSIESRSALPVIDLPLVRAYHLDLGFPLSSAAMSDRRCNRRRPDYVPDSGDRALLAAMQDGLPLVKRPYRSIADTLGVHEDDVIARLEKLTGSGVVTRFGCVVRHRRLGYTANAMAVWDVADDRTDDVGERFARHPGVTLCYRRPRRLPLWRHNLFCMVHAKTEADACAVIDELGATAATDVAARDVLFSRRCFKQRGAVFSSPAAGVN